MAREHERSGDTRTDIINRAVQVYEEVEEARRQGKIIYLYDPETGARERLIIGTLPPDESTT
ncbi:hypothetical protein D5H75_38065 [Bailinhaonella thermotolerans]|uniref:Uncharacterized protein n=1 Tax=Bailinhaonella thermotolerans TaxID=1070861 RepID=A0A3A4A800_9ACTN|nr:hypothetical protein D5H75_38065 [Bailinhaonella thermotolerans]